MKTPIVLAVLLSVCPTVLAEGWELETLNGREYVATESIKKFYNFDIIKENEGLLELENRKVSMKLNTGSREVVMNGVKFIFESKILFHEGRHLISREDLAWTIDPILRPNFIGDSGYFRTVVIDPGHGGEDPGAVNKLGAEKDFTLKVANSLKKEMEKAGYKVIMTRDADITISKAERLKKINVVENAILLCIHFKSSKKPDQKGIETIVLSTGDPGKDHKASLQNRQSIALATAIHGTCLRDTGFRDGGIRRSGNSLLAGVKHPAVLLVGGYMSHPAEARMINDVRYQEGIAKSIASAVQRYRYATGGLRAVKKAG